MSDPLPTPRVRVVVVTYDSGGHLEDFLTSLRRASRAPVPVVVADNGSTDGAPERASTAPGVRLLRTGGNVGYGAAANAGLRAGGTEPWVLVANPDIVFSPGSIDALVAAADRLPRAGTVGPRIHTAAGRLYPSARRVPSLSRGIGHALFGWIWPTNPWTAAYRREQGDPREGPTGWLSGSCLLVRREAFEAVGGFDEGFFMYFEDLDLCERIGRAGWDNVYVPSVLVTHAGGHSTRAHAVPMQRAHHASAYRYLSRRYAAPWQLPLRLALRAGLWGRFQLSRVVDRVGHGAQPTRRAGPV